MGYICTHHRKVRGEGIHDTMDDKNRAAQRLKKEFGDVPMDIIEEVLEKEYMTADGRIVRGCQIHKPMDIDGLEHRVNDKNWHKSKKIKDYEVAKKKFMDEHPELIRETIESTYLVPEVEHFVETKDVKNIEASCS